MMTNTPAFAEATSKFKTFKSERRKTASRSVQSNYFNFMNPSMSEKILAYQCALYDEDEDTYGFISQELAEACKFDPWRALLYLQQIAVEMTDLAIRAFRLMLENLKPKPKEVYDYKMAEAVDKKEYDFSFTGEFDGKKFPKGSKKYKKWEFGKDKKGQSDFERNSFEREFAQKKDTTRIDYQKKSEQNQSNIATGVAQAEMATRGGGMSYATWGDGGCGNFGPCGPSIDYGIYAMEL